MPLEEIRPGIDEFPVGMRVLAVDDDPTCLMVLGGLLRKCQYQVTTTTDAKTALEMLRIDRKRFDLIISDVYMPDMDGFRLLELIGLEMDLPVIMLSADSDPKLVMKGINHGAVDYLVKPVRIEELRNIWQHVIRRKKVQPKEQNKNRIEGMSHQGNQEGRIQDESIGNEQRGKRGRKRKEEEECDVEEEEQESEGNGTENEDPSSHKKPRVVWSKPLHKKFLAAVEQLGMKNAVPKKILEMMNVEGISRENVASHLQKYRSFIKRINNSVSNEQMQANLIAAYMQDSSSYAPTNPFNGLGSFPRQQQSIHQASGSLHSSLLPPYQTSPVLARANTPSVSLQSGGIFGNQPTHSRNSLDYSLPNASGNPLLPQGTQLQRQSGGVFGNQPTHSRNSLDYPLPNASGNPLLPQGTLQGTQLQRQSGGVFGNKHSLCSNPKPLMTGFNGDWQMTLPPSNLLPNTMPLSEPFDHNNQSNALHFPSVPNTMPLSEPFDHNNQSNALHFPSTMPERCYNPNQRMSDSNSMVSSCLGMGQFSESLDQNNGLWGRNTDSSFVGQSNVDALPLQQFGEIERLGSGSLTGSSKDHHSDQMNSQQGGFLFSGCDFSLDDLLNVETKPGLGTVSMNPGGFDFDDHSF